MKTAIIQKDDAMEALETLPLQYRASEELEAFLGDPADPANVMSFHNVMAWDEQEAFPQAAVDELYRFGMNHYYVPAAYGGRFTSYEEFQSLARVAARRDLTTAITYSTLIWSTLIWVGGNEQQKHRLAKLLRWTKDAPTLAYSEEQHGADLVANDMKAVKTEGGYRLSGEKWPINRATRSGIVAVLAKTSNERDTRSLSLFMLEKRDLDPAQYSNPPRVKTLGLRGCDISGIRFHDCLVPESSRVGAVGEGLELALRAFQVTRTLCAGLSLAAADTALRVTMDFAIKRKLYGGTVFTIPIARRTLSDAFLDMLICDCMATAAARGLHVSTEQFSVWSAVVKYFVPVTLERATQQLSVVLGARHFIRERHHAGIFQKMLRDGGVVSLFDGSTQVCLHALGLQLRHLVKTRRREQDGDDTARNARLTTIFSLDETLPVFDGSRLDLFSRGHDDVMQGLLAAVTAIRDLHDTDGVEPALLDHLQHLAGLAAEALHDFDGAVDAAAAAGLHPQSPELFDLAARYATLHAAAACMSMWLHNRARLDAFFADGAWLVLALERLLSRLRPLHLQLPESYRQRVADRLAELFNENRLFSIVPLALAKTEVTADSTQKEDSHERQCN